MNQFGFAASDPVNNSDPLGLKVCFSGGTEAERRRMADALAVAAEVSYTWNSTTGCMENARAINPNSRIANQVAAFINNTTRTATFRPGRLPNSGTGRNDTGSGMDSYFGGNIVRFLIDLGDTTRTYGVVPNGTRPCLTVQGATYTLEMIMLHELGHASDFFTPVFGVDEAMTFERAYTQRMQMPSRPPSCH